MRPVAGQATIYLLHFAEKVSGKQHYIGVTHNANLNQRLDRHARGHASNLTARVVEAGVTIYVVNLWRDKSPSFERTLKNRGNAKHLCPMCSPKAKLGSLFAPRALPKNMLPEINYQPFGWIA